MMSIARILPLFLLLISPLAVSSVRAQAQQGQGGAEIIRLKDGRTFRGQVIQHEGDRSVLFRADDGRTLRVNLAQVDYIGPENPPEDAQAESEAAFEIVDLSEEATAGDDAVSGVTAAGDGYPSEEAMEGGVSMSFAAPRDGLSLIVRPAAARSMGREYGWMRFCDLPCEKPIRPGYYELRLQNMESGRITPVLGQVPLTREAHVDFQMNANFGKRLSNFITGGIVGGIGIGLLAHGAWHLRNYCYRGRDGVIYGSGTCARGAGFTVLGSSLLVVGTVFVILGFTKRKNVARARLLSFGQF